MLGSTATPREARQPFLRACVSYAPVSAINTCHRSLWDAAKGAVQATVYIQFGLFSVFGLILTSSVLFACFRPMPDKKALDRARVQNNGIYAVFSVLAKTALDIGFLLVVTLRAR